MQIQKSETNNAIVTRLKNVRPHPNADRLKLATVLGTQVVVGLDSKEDDLILYFDSNLRLSHEYLHWNNLYSNKELNSNQEVKGYFGKNGRVRSQKFRGEVSNGYVAPMESLFFLGIVSEENSCLNEGNEFTHINGIEICSKYIVPVRVGCTKRTKKSAMFHEHWDTKQLMRELHTIPGNSLCYVEEKIHGTSGRTGHVLCRIYRPWWKFWKPKEEWKVISGTRRVDSIESHIPEVRKEIETRVIPHLHKGEEIYYEIYGYSSNCAMVQSGFPYNCKPGEWKCLLYRVTITTPDGFIIDLDREQVYQRAEELGLEKPVRLVKIYVQNGFDWEESVLPLAEGRSRLDASTLREGIVVWFQNSSRQWTCLKHKSPEFLMDQDSRIEKNEGDVEDQL